MRTIGDELKFNKNNGKNPLMRKPMPMKPRAMSKNPGDDMFKVVKLGTEVLLGTAMIGAVAGAVKSAFP